MIKQFRAFEHVAGSRFVFPHSVQQECTLFVSRDADRRRKHVRHSDGKRHTKRFGDMASDSISYGMLLIKLQIVNCCVIKWC